jgi:hypothetical protein
MRQKSCEKQRLLVMYVDAERKERELQKKRKEAIV